MTIFPSVERTWTSIERIIDDDNDILFDLENGPVKVLKNCAITKNIYPDIKIFLHQRLIILIQLQLINN